MSTIMILTLVLVISTIILGVYVTKCKVEGKNMKKYLGLNLTSFLGLLIAATVMVLSGPTATAATNEVAASTDGIKYIAAALSTGLACIGAGIAVAVTGSAAIGAISENEKLLGKTIIFVGLAEGVAIYGFIISIMILN